MILNMAGGGSAGLNFKVVGGTTQPASPAENTIWVNTDTAITDWVFSSTQPAASDGRVWLRTSTASNVAFNALKKNGLWVYLSGCSQYIGGVWVDKAVLIYQSGMWKSLTIYLYEPGNLHTDITGGWSHSGYRQLAGSPSGGSWVGTNEIGCTGATNSAEGCIGTNNLINLTGYSTLHYVGYSTSTENATCYVSSSKQTFQPNALAAGWIQTTLSETTVDIRYLSSAYICFTAGSAGNQTTHITNVWLE